MQDILLISQNGGILEIFHQNRITIRTKQSERQTEYCVDDAYSGIGAGISISAKFIHRVFTAMQVITFGPSIKRAMLVERIRATERVKIAGIGGSLYSVDCHSIGIRPEGVWMVTGMLDAIPREAVPILQEQILEIGSGIESKLVGMPADASVAVKVDSTEVKKYEWNPFIHYPGRPVVSKYAFMNVPISNVTSRVL